MVIARLIIPIEKVLNYTDILYIIYHRICIMNNTKRLLSKHNAYFSTFDDKKRRW